MVRIESLLSARLFLAPQVSGDRLFFISNLTGRLSLYAMDYGGSVPEPLLPPEIALQNPHLIDGKSFSIFPKIDKILVMIDHDGDENYQPMVIPLSGGYPEPAFGSQFDNTRCHMGNCDIDKNILYLTAESRSESLISSYQANLETGEVTFIAASPWGATPAAVDEDHKKAVIIDPYMPGDAVLYLWEREKAEKRLIYGVPLDQRPPGYEAPLPGFISANFTKSGGVLFGLALYEDTYSPGYMDLKDAENIRPVEVTGKIHTGSGEMVQLDPLKDNRYLVGYNIDGASWYYEATFDEKSLCLQLERVLAGEGILSNGVLESIYYDKAGDRYALSFSTATSPTQIYTIEGPDRKTLVVHTRERLLGIPEEWLSPGEDASFVSFDGLRVSARLYLPAPVLGFTGPRPVVYYVHGGPQGQERPDFAWFSMPLIQFLTINGFAVFVPNVRGSTGYGLTYMKHVDHDWGGKDREDHLFALDLLAKDNRVDVKRAAVVGRSYGGYMTLTLAGRDPERWAAAADMFGPYDLVTFFNRLPETWKPYFRLALGDPTVEEDHRFLQERSPATYIDQVSCPLLVIQGKNDPRVVERESRDLVEHLRSEGKQVEYLMFENEGHDVLKFENRVTCYNTITNFFKTYLKP